MIKVSSPGKLMLFGDHAVVHGRPCIVTTVNQRVSVLLKKRIDEKIILNTPDSKFRNYCLSAKDLEKSHPKEICFLLKSIKNFFEKYKIRSGLEIETKSEFSSLIGLGSSSAVIVSAIKGLARLFGKKINKKELFNLAYETVLDIQEVGSGFDIAAAIYGGTLFFVTAGKIIEKIKVKELPIIIVYTGIKADTPTLVKMVRKKLLKEPKKINKIFDEIEVIVNLARIEIENLNWEMVGKLMNRNQDLLRKLGVTSKKIENLIQVALSSGAFGAKLSGAGGGDCMITITNLRNQENVKKAIAKAGGKIIEVRLQAKGVEIERFCFK
jgi:mevalonate kinase